MEESRVRNGLANALPSPLVFALQWLAGDLTNLLGALWQGLLPTMVILAVYYTLCDIVLIFQVRYRLPPSPSPLSDSRSTPKTRAISAATATYRGLEATERQGRLAWAAGMMDQPPANAWAQRWAIVLRGGSSPGGTPPSVWLRPAEGDGAWIFA